MRSSGSAGGVSGEPWPPRGLSKVSTYSQLSLANISFAIVLIFHLRIFELAHPPELLTLHTSWIIRITFDLLLPTSDTRDRQPLPRLPRLRYSPVSIHCLAINYGLAMRPIVIKITQSFAWNISLTNETRQELRSCPYLRSESVFRRRFSNGTGGSGWVGWCLRCVVAVCWPVWLGSVERRGMGTVGFIVGSEGRRCVSGKVLWTVL